MPRRKPSNVQNCRIGETLTATRKRTATGFCDNFSPLSGWGNLRFTVQITGYPANVSNPQGGKSTDFSAGKCYLLYFVVVPESLTEIDQFWITNPPVLIQHVLDCPSFLILGAADVRTPSFVREPYAVSPDWHLLHGPFEQNSWICSPSSPATRGKTGRSAQVFATQGGTHWRFWIKNMHSFWVKNVSVPNGTYCNAYTGGGRGPKITILARQNEPEHAPAWMGRAHHRS